jgi:hypothetical protein
MSSMVLLSIVSYGQKSSNDVFYGGGWTIGLKKWALDGKTIPNINVDLQYKNNRYGLDFVVKEKSETYTKQGYGIYYTTPSFKNFSINVGAGLLSEKWPITRTETSTKTTGDYVKGYYRSNGTYVNGYYRNVATFTETKTILIGEEKHNSIYSIIGITKYIPINEDFGLVVRNTTRIFNISNKEIDNEFSIGVFHKMLYKNR